MRTRKNDSAIKFRLEDGIETISHSKFKKYASKLSKEIAKYIAENNLRIDYVVPVFRGGAVPAVYIANELNLIKFAPIQMKKIKQNGKYDRILLLNSLKDLDREKNLNLLVVDDTVGAGDTLHTIVDEIRETLPKATILFACIFLRDGTDLPENIQASFFGSSMAREKVFVYPWEIKEQKETRIDQEIENIFY